jgi:hypothetical protein
MASRPSASNNQMLLEEGLPSVSSQTLVGMDVINNTSSTSRVGSKRNHCQIDDSTGSQNITSSVTDQIQTKHSSKRRKLNPDDNVDQVDRQKKRLVHVDEVSDNDDNDDFQEEQTKNVRQNTSDKTSNARKGIFIITLYI